MTHSSPTRRSSVLFPHGLIKSVEIVTGGASAAYVSDAVSGVVNFILDKEYTGIKGSAEYGITTYGDAPNYRATLTAGRSEEHTSELQSLMRISYAVFCLKKKKPDLPEKKLNPPPIRLTLLHIALSTIYVQTHIPLMNNITTHINQAK